MDCGIPSRDPETDTGAAIRKAINMGKGSMAAKKLSLEIKIFSSPLRSFFFKKVYCGLFIFQIDNQRLIYLLFTFSMVL